MHPSSREYLDGEENLPLYYGKDCLVLLPRDPYWLFAYWEISIPTRQRFEAEFHKPWDSLQLLLRVYRYDAQGTGKESHFDIQFLPRITVYKSRRPNKNIKLNWGVICRKEDSATSSHPTSLPHPETASAISSMKTGGCLIGRPAVCTGESHAAILVPWK